MKKKILEKWDQIEIENVQSVSAAGNLTSIYFYGKNLSFHAI